MYFLYCILFHFCISSNISFFVTHEATIVSLSFHLKMVEKGRKPQKHPNSSFSVINII